MLVQVDGWSGSGKSVLMYLLDGHPEIYSHPFHDVLQFLFKEIDWDEDWVKHKDIWELRKRLVKNTHYYKSESYIRQKKYVVEFKTGIQLDFPISLNFSDIDRAFIDKLSSIENWTPENILESIFQSYCQEVGADSKKYAFMGGWKGFDNIDSFNELYPNAKRIVVKRNIFDIVAVQAGRKPIDIEFRSKSLEDRDVVSIIKSGEIEAYKKYYDNLEKLAHRFPDKLLVIGFDDLIRKKTKTLKRVCSFLDINYIKDNKSTFLGNHIYYNGIDYADQVLDNYKELLTKKEIENIEKVYSTKSIIKIPNIMPFLLNKNISLSKLLIKKLS